MYSTGEKLINSITASIKNIILHMDLPMAAGVIFFAVVMMILKLIYKNDFKSKVNLKQICIYSLSVIYITFLAEITLIQRIGVEQSPPFSEIWGDWSVFKTDKIMYLNFNPVINFVIMIPMAFVTKFALRIKKGYILKTTLISLCASCIIETCQIIFKLGTFQISDLVYNTLSGLLGCLVLLLIRLIYKKRKCRK